MTERTTLALVLDPADNVAVATTELAAGDRIELGDRTVPVREPIAMGHKFAIDPIQDGAQVHKYGETIGIAIREIPLGAHVHVHNVLSARLPGDAAR